MKTNLGNWFTVDVVVSFPQDEQGRNLNKWLNIQYTGKPLIPLTDNIDKQHVDASWDMHRSRRVRITFEVNKKGKWKLHGAHFI